MKSNPAICILKDTMTSLPQFIIAVMIFLVIVGTLLFPELATYGTQLIALLLVFYFILNFVAKKQQRKEVIKAREDEETLLFLTTFLKPKLEDLVDLTHREENLELLKKQIQLTQREVERFLEEKEKET